MTAPYRTQFELAARLGIKQPRVSQILKSAGLALPLDEADVLELERDLDDRRAMNGTTADAATGPVADRLRAARLEVARQQLALLRTENRVERGELLDVQRFARRVQRALADLRSHLLGFRYVWEPRTPEADHYAALRDTLSDFKRNFSNATQQATEDARVTTQENAGPDPREARRRQRKAERRRRRPGRR